jgi:hypothetical protein
MTTNAFLMQFLPPDLDRPVYIWGAGLLGCMAAAILTDFGRPPEAFIDRAAGLARPWPVHGPDLLPRIVAEKPFILITPYFDYAKVEEGCRRHGLRDGSDFVSYASLRSTVEYSVEIAGPPGSRRFMRPKDFGRVLDKINTDSPGTWDVELFDWHDPLTHPELGDILKAARDRNIFPAIHTSFDHRRDLSPLTENPQVIARIQTGLERPQAGREEFRANLEELLAAYPLHRPMISIEYWLSKDTDPADCRLVRGLAADWGLRFIPVHGFCRSLAEVEAYFLGEPVGDAERELLAGQFLGLDEAMAKAEEQKERPCGFRNCFLIDDQLRVRCYNRPGDDFGPYLAISLDRLLADRADNPVCRDCRAGAWHRYPSICGSTILGRKLVHKVCDE